MNNVDLAEDIFYAHRNDLAFRREWSRYELRNRMANEAYERLSPTIDRRYGAA